MYTVVKNQTDMPHDILPQKMPCSRLAAQSPQTLEHVSRHIVVAVRLMFEPQTAIAQVLRIPKIMIEHRTRVPPQRPARVAQPEMTFVIDEINKVVGTETANGVPRRDIIQRA